MAKKINHPKAIAQLYTFSSQNKFNKYKLSESIIEINKALTIVTSEKYPRFKSQMNLQHAKLLLAQNKLNKAIEILNKEVIKLKQIWDVKQLNTANNLLAQAYIKNKQFDKADETINRELDNLQFYIGASTKEKIQQGLGQMLKESLNIYALVNKQLGQSELGFMRINEMINRFNTKNKSLQILSSNENIDLFSQINAKSIALENQTLSEADRKQIQSDMIELKAQIDFSFEAQVTQNQTTAGFKAIQASLDNETLVIQYSIGEAGGISWWISKDKVETHEMANKSELFQLINLARDEFISGNKNTENTRLLSQKLLHPLQSFNQVKRIKLILDEPLNLVPFNALFDPRYENKYVIENTKTKRVASVQALNSKSSSLVIDHKSNTALVVADPVTTFNDMRLPDGILNEIPNEFNRLPATGKEAKKIHKLINAETIQGFDANKDNLLSLNLKDKSLLHFATHAFFHPEISGLSSLVLSTYNQKGESNPTAYLRALDISNLILNADLVVLSGCETGVNRKDDSLGLGGLTESFMQAGSKNLIASLWDVDDRDTSDLMIKFYEEYNKGSSIEDSLYSAQKMIRETRGTSHPQYWAGWFLITQ